MSGCGDGPGRPVAARLLLIASLPLLAGCNTFSGVGRDITGGAEFLQVYMPPEFQNHPGGGAGQTPAQPTGYTASPGAVYGGTGGGVPALGAV